MAGRKHHEEEHENHERWLVSYADFITLLFAFFVVMYALSSVNLGKFRVLSDSIARALNPVITTPASPKPFSIAESTTALAPSARAKDRVIQTIKRRLTEDLSVSPYDGAIEITQDARGIIISLAERVLFHGGDSQLSSHALPLIKELAEVLTEVDHPVRVEGHTDNLPIHTARYPSNWELSADRAATVTRLMVLEYGFPPSLITAAGRGEHAPVADNRTPDGRAKNRRVDIVVEVNEQSLKDIGVFPDPFGPLSQSNPTEPSLTPSSFPAHHQSPHIEALEVPLQQPIVPPAQT